jgi:hypothetical protein
MQNFSEIFQDPFEKKMILSFFTIKLGYIQYVKYYTIFKKKNLDLGIPNTGGPLLTLFFETLEKQPCKQKTL